MDGVVKCPMYTSSYGIEVDNDSDLLMGSSEYLSWIAESALDQTRRGNAFTAA